MTANHKSRTLSLFRAVAATALMTFAGASLAQAPAQPPQGGGAMGHDMMGGHDMGGMGGHDMMGSGMGAMMRKMTCGFAEHLDGRLAYLKAELKLTDAQQAAWTSFTDAYRAAAQTGLQKCAALDAAASGDHAKHHGVLGHLTMMERHMTDHLEVVRALKAAIEPFFATLTEEQKKAAEQAMSGVMGVGMGGMMGGSGGGMMGGMGESGGGMMGGMMGGHDMKGSGMQHEMGGGGAAH
ncbi:MAG TPA: Spy/CpxP family protein refolding chaperone [Methylocystis sp.]|nr:Spy/CpxP family protein refolding chaperone [Methylocystis sp.]